MRKHKKIQDIKSMTKINNLMEYFSAVKKQ